MPKKLPKITPEVLHRSMERQPPPTEEELAWPDTSTIEGLCELYEYEYEDWLARRTAQGTEWRPNKPKSAKIGKEWRTFDGWEDVPNTETVVWEMLNASVESAGNPGTLRDPNRFAWHPPLYAPLLHWIIRKLRSIWQAEFGVWRPNTDPECEVWLVKSLQQIDDQLKRRNPEEVAVLVRHLLQEMNKRG